MRKHLTTFFLASAVACALLLSLWLAAGIQQEPASAYAFVTASDPADGSTVSSPPPAVIISFDAPISPASAASVYNAQEQPVNAASSFIPSGNPRELVILLKDGGQLPSGGYIVRWTALATGNGQTTHGVIGFNIRQSSFALPGQTIVGPQTSTIFPTLDALSLLTIAWEWLISVALMFWVGILVMESLIYTSGELRAPLLPRLRKRTRSLMQLSLATLAAGEIMALLLRTARLAQLLNGQPFELAALGQVLFQSTYGFLWMARGALILASLWLLWRAGKRPGHFITGWLILAGLILLTCALTSGATLMPVGGVILGWLSLAAQYTWFGGLVYLACIFLPLAPVLDAENRIGTLSSLLRRFQPLMLSAMCILIITALYTTGSHLGSIQQLTTEAYGRALLIILAFILIMVMGSMYALSALFPRLREQQAVSSIADATMPARQIRLPAPDGATRSLRRVVIAQSWLAVAVLLITAWAAFFGPPAVFANTRQNSVAVTHSSIVPAQTQQAGNLSITLAISPATIHASHTITVRLVGRRGNIVTKAEVAISANMEAMDMGTARAVMTLHGSVYRATFAPGAAFSMAGVWVVRVTIQEPEQPTVTVDFDVNIAS